MSDKEWEEYTSNENNEHISIERWGVDHWSTLAYLETRAVDHGGIINNAQMRCNIRLHRDLVYINPVVHEAKDGSRYPTRLRDGETAANHDDWSCLEDMVAMGLIRAWFRVIKHSVLVGNSQAKIQFTGRGYRIVGRLREHRARGGNYAGFCVGFHELFEAIS